MVRSTLWAIWLFVADTFFRANPTGTVELICRISCRSRWLPVDQMQFHFIETIERVDHRCERH